MSQKVLIVEDQFLEARSLSIMLKNAGHLVEGIAKSVDQALEFMDKGRPDVVLLEYWPPFFHAGEISIIRNC